MDFQEICRRYEQAQTALNQLAAWLGRDNLGAGMARDPVGAAPECVNAYCDHVSIDPAAYFETWRGRKLGDQRTWTETRWLERWQVEQT